MAFLKRGLHLATKQIAYLLIILTVVAISLAGALYWLSNAVEQRQDEIAAWVGEQLGYPVEIGSAGLHLFGLVPKLQVDNVSVLAKDKSSNLLSLESLYLGLDLLSSIKQSEVILNDMTLTGVHLAIERTESGEFKLQGLDNPSADTSDNDWQAWMNVLNQCQMQMVRIDYLDRQQNALSGEYLITELLLSHQSDEWITSATLHLAESLGADIRISTQLTYDYADASLGQWEMEAYIENLSLAPLSSQLAWQDVGVKKGTLSAIIIAKGEKERFETAQINLDLSHTEIISTQKDKVISPAVVERLAGQIDWQQGEQTWQLLGRDIQLTMNGDSWPKTEFSIKKKLGNTWSVESNYLRLSDITSLALLSTESPEVIQHQKPAGDIEQLKLQYTESEGINKLMFNLRDGAMLPWQDYPGVTGLTASLNWQEGLGGLKFDSHKLTVYPETWLDDAVFFDSVTGELNLQQQGENWTLQSHALRLWNDELTLQLDGSVRHTADGKTLNDLQIAMEEVSINRWKYYVPQKILSEDFKQWANKAFVAGKIIDGKIELKGDSDAFPYDIEPEKGVFKMAFQVEDVQLHYGPGWPDLIGVNGTVTGLRNDLIIKSQHGTIAGYNFTDVTTTINKLVERKPILRVDGTLAGETSEALSFLGNSPLKQRFEKIAKSAKAQGKSHIKLNLMVPLADVDRAEVSGQVSFLDNQLHGVALPDVAVSKINGNLNFTNDGVTADNIKARVFSEPVSINVKPKDDATIVSIKGQLSASNINDVWPNSMPKFISGKTPYEVNVVISEKTVGDFYVDASMQSDLHGIAIDLPAPYTKSIKESRHIVASIQQKDDIPVYAFKYNGLFNAIIAPDKQRWRGEIKLGSGKVALPAHGIKVRGKLTELSINDWLKWSTQYSEKTESTFVESMNDTSITIDKVSGFNQLLTNLKIVANKDKKGWRAKINSKQTNGLIYWPNDSSTSLKIDLDKVAIALPKSKVSDANNNAEKSDELWPAIDLSIGSLSIDDMALGKLRLQSNNTGKEWTVEAASLTSDVYQLEILETKWRKTTKEEQTSVRIHAKSDDLAAVLENFGYQQAIEAKDVDLLADLSWPDNPLAVSAKSINGSLYMTVGRGKLNDVEPGAAGRIFGLMSIAALPRRLSLDFSDLFSKGFYFDSISGAFDFKNGLAVTDDFTLSGSSASIEMTGPINMVEKMYDQKVTIRPNVSSTLPLAGAVAGGPVGLGVGAALLLVDKLAGAIFDKNIVNVISYSYKLSGPWSEPDLTVFKPIE